MRGNFVCCFIKALKKVLVSGFFVHPTGYEIEDMLNKVNRDSRCHSTLDLQTTGRQAVVGEFLKALLKIAGSAAAAAAVVLLWQQQLRLSAWRQHG